MKLGWYNDRINAYENIYKKLLIQDVLLAQCSALLVLQIFEQGVGIITIHVDFAVHIERDAIVVCDEFFYFWLRPGLLKIQIRFNLGEQESDQSAISTCDPN